MSPAHILPHLPKDLGNGLILRQATSADTEAMVAFNRRIHPENADEDQFIASWTRSLMSGHHPTVGPADFILVEDAPADHKIVSATCLISQTWQYAGIPFAVGQPELVGTDSAYRRRGLTRLIFEEIHRLSEAKKELVQGITGIPWFYRQFGYEYALPLQANRVLRLDAIPALPEGEEERYLLRPATEKDIPTLIRQCRQFDADKLITVPMDETRWRYELSERSKYIAKYFCIITNRGKVVGYTQISTQLWHGDFTVWTLTLDDQTAMAEVLPDVARAFKAQALAYHAQQALPPDKLPSIILYLGTKHPAYQAYNAKLAPMGRSYSWYIRVADTPGFINHIAPALEDRLANSVMRHYTGSLKLQFYRGGLKMDFEGGKLVSAENWQAPDPGQQWTGAGFPPLVFLQLLMGYRSMDELRDWFPDCWADDEPHLLLEILFPKRASWVLQFV